MGAIDKIKRFAGKKSREKWGCREEQNGLLSCRIWREFEDGTTTETAGFDVALDGSCKGYPSNMFENEPGALEKLERKAWKNIRDKCKSSIQNKPIDY